MLNVFDEKAYTLSPLKGKLYLGYKDNIYSIYHQYVKNANIINVEHNFNTLEHAKKWMNDHRQFDDKLCECCQGNIVTQDEGKWFCFFCSNNNNTEFKCGCVKGNFNSKNYSININNLSNFVHKSKLIGLTKISGNRYIVRWSEQQRNLHTNTLDDKIKYIDFNDNYAMANGFIKLLEKYNILPANFQTYLYEKYNYL